MERLHFLSRFRGDETTVSAGAILIIAIAASGVLMMRFRKRWLARINIAFTNRITSQQLTAVLAVRFSNMADR